MGRKPRIEYHGAVYHVIKRGNNREYIFEGEEQKNTYANHTMKEIGENISISETTVYKINNKRKD